MLTPQFISGIKFSFNIDGLKETFSSPKAIIDNLPEIGKSPTSIIAILAVLILIFLAIKMKKIKLSPQVMSMVAVVSALNIVLSLIKFFTMPQGGSVTLGSLVPILFISFVYGPEIGFLAGAITGILSLLINPWIVHPVQVLLDYILPTMTLGVAGYFTSKRMKIGLSDYKLRIIGTVVAATIKYIWHVLSGVVFFAEYAGGQNVWIYSLGYNSFVFADMLVAIIILCVLPITRIQRQIRTIKVN